ncbi:hypothetical protein CBS101457_003231 [Exobasidium rhododendri]|nr:hypothetical protein CBS101457_003231 [Exobasidium rhododendri]
MIATKQGRVLASLLVLASSLCSVLASEASTVPSVASEENHLLLGRNPHANYLSSPLKSRLDAKKRLKTALAKSSHRKARRSSRRGVSSDTHLTTRSTCKVKTEKVHKAGVNTIYSGVYPTVNLTWVAPNGTKQSFVSFVDTGSSDTWVIGKDFQCVNITSLDPLPQSGCGFGKLFKNDHGFKNITSQEFSVSYFPEMESLSGSMGYHSLELAGIHVKKQQVALVDNAAWLGDNHSSGLLGLGFPSITSSTYRSNGSSIEYDPIFFTMFKKNLTKPVFTLALDRVPRHTPLSAKAGVLALGGLVPEHLFKRPFTTVPIEKFQNDTELEFYTISNEFVYGKTSKSNLTTTGKFQSLVDSGTGPNFMPTKHVNKLNALFDPPAVYNATLDYFTVDCKAKAPYAAFIIGGKVMPMDSRDMIVRSLNGIEGYEDVCFSSFARGGKASEDEMLIGEVWQRSYVVSYDIGNTKLHIAPRRSY